MTFTFRTVDEALAGVGLNVGPSGRIPITQERIDRFADATGDHQWLHVDPERAASGPFGATIAHGYLTLSLINMVLPDLIMPDNLNWGVNYGCDRVRFPAPVRVGSRVRMAGEVTKVDKLDELTVQVTLRITVEIEGDPKTVFVADVLARYSLNGAK